MYSCQLLLDYYGHLCAATKMGNIEHLEPTSLIQASSPLFYFQQCRVSLWVFEKMQVLCWGELWKISMIIRVMVGILKPVYFPCHGPDQLYTRWQRGDA